ncbi:MAG: hypothetical protein M3R08_08450 [Bacteroidota bacterium]|nr:hypothetical protein [Bacteroidota bacterium]
MIRTLHLLLFIPLLSCTPEVGDTKIIAHAGTGSGFDHPKNSREALLTALKIGAHGIEVDVQMTKDSVLVIYHDEDLQSLTSCQGLINSMERSELKQCDPAIDGHQFQILRLDSFLMEAARSYPDAEFMLDCKLFAHGEWWPYLETYSDALVRLNSNLTLYGKISVECMVDDFLLLIQRKNADLPLFMYGSEIDHIIWRAATSHYRGITCQNRHISASEVAMAQGLGLEVTLLGTDGWWSDQRALSKDPDRLQTDSPEDLLDQGALTN